MVSSKVTRCHAVKRIDATGKSFLRTGSQNRNGYVDGAVADEPRFVVGS